MGFQVKTGGKDGHHHLPSDGGNRAVQEEPVLRRADRLACPDDPFLVTKLLIYKDISKEISRNFFRFPLLPFFQKWSFVIKRVPKHIPLESIYIIYI